MVGKRGIGNIIFTVINSIVMILLIIVCLYPMLYVFFASISEPAQLLQLEGILYKPMGFTLKGYEMVLSNPQILKGYENTLFYVFVGTIVNLLMTSVAAYTMSRKDLMFGKPIMILIVFTMYFGGGMIPDFLLVDQLGLLNSRLALILPGAISVYNMIVMRTSFLEIPSSIEESARIDGANDWTILVRIILPLSKAVLAVMALFYGVGHWNSWFGAMIYLRDRDKYPLQLILREILLMNASDNMTSESGIGRGDISAYKMLVQYSTIVVATVPILFIYPFIQKHFTKGVMIGAIKG